MRLSHYQDYQIVDAYGYLRFLFFNEEAYYELAEKSSQELVDGDESILEECSHITHGQSAGSETPTEEDVPDFSEFGLTFGRNRDIYGKKKRGISPMSQTGLSIVRPDPGPIGP
jgi:hypothetical protein